MISSIMSSSLFFTTLFLTSFQEFRYYFACVLVCLSFCFVFPLLPVKICQLLNLVNCTTIFQAKNSFHHGRRSVRNSRGSPTSSITPTARRSPSTYITSTPTNRQSAPNLSSMLNSPLSDAHYEGKADDLTAEVDLSDELGVAPMHDSHEDTPMFTPRTNSRIVRIISKQSNV